MAKRILKRPYAELLPLLSTEEFEALKADLLANGQREAVVIDHEGNVLDGHNRYEILGAKTRTQVLNGCANMSPAERKAYALRVNLNRRQLSPTQKQALERETLVPLANELRWGPDWETEKGKPLRTEDQVGKMLGRPQRTIARWTAEDASTSRAANACTSDRPRTDQKIPKAEYPKILARAQRGDTQRAIAGDYKTTRQRIAQVVKSETKREAAEAKRKARLQKARKLSAGEDLGIKLGDFRRVAETIEGDSVDLIFTDPPYDRESLPLYEDLAQIGARVLVPGGSLICYLGQYQIHEVLERMVDHVRLWWTLAVIHTGQKARMREYGVVVHWKPLLWFVKGTRAEKETFVDDLVMSEQEKTCHEWQQSLKEASYYIGKLCPKNGLTFDPFCGGGTTAVAAKALKRRWLTCDSDEPAVILARERIQGP